MSDLSLLQQLRLQYLPTVPKALQSLSELRPVFLKEKKPEEKSQKIAEYFPRTHGLEFLTFEEGFRQPHAPKKVGVVLSGGQAPGGHNVITGLFDALKKLHQDSRLFGFLNGPSGIIIQQYIEITEELLSTYRNQGGFDLIGSGRTKIEKEHDLKKAKETAQALDLDGLVVIGGDDSNTNAAHLAEFFKVSGCKTAVVGVPKTIDGDLKNEWIEVSFGFDTATKIYSEIIGNIARDALSAKKSYYFIKMMGRSASHITLECAFQTRPNFVLIGEEIQANKQTLDAVAAEIAELVIERAELKKDYGVILIPEGIIEFIPEFRVLITELNHLLSEDQPHAKALEGISGKEEKVAYIKKLISEEALGCFSSIPLEIQMQVLMDRDPHGNVQVSKIETERLLIEMVRLKLAESKKQGRYQGKFSAQSYFCGYEGRSGLPSNFDANYCYSLGMVGALLVDANKSGYLALVHNLTAPAKDWKIGGCPLAGLMNLEERHGKMKPVIKKALVELEGKPFQAFKSLRESWMLNDAYCFPGPIQFFGPKELVDSFSMTLEYEKK